MIESLLPMLAIIVGFIVLAWSADRLVDAAEAVSHIMNISPLIIGMVIIGFATSAPELTVSSIAAWHNGVDLAIGNAIGSNVANIALVLGCTAIIAPIVTSSSLVRQEIPLLLLVSGIAWWLMADGHLSRIDGLCLLMILLASLFLLVKLEQRRHSATTMDVPHPSLTQQQAWIQLLYSLVLLAASARLLVWGAVTIAHQLHISELVIGLSVVALGTSLPELAASVASAMRRNHALVLGNIIGSNLFNTLAVIGLPAVIHPDNFSADVLQRDFPIMIAVTVLLLLLALSKHGLTRISGILLLLVYVGYMVLCIKF
jgi:cation:H+ antiporter